MIRTLSMTVLAGALALAAGPAWANPTLKASVMVDSAIVTVGDMFSDADILAEKPLFRAPRPGTSGEVSVSAIKTAAARVGLTDFDNPGIISVDVARKGTRIDAQMIDKAILDDLDRRGILTDGLSAKITLGSALDNLFAEPSGAPLTLDQLNYRPLTGQFTASFTISGRRQPLTLGGRIDMMINAPYLKTSMPAGAILSPDNIEMRSVEVGMAHNGHLPTLDQLVGKQLKRPARAGMILTSADVQAPLLVARNDTVTLYYKAGALTLTARGQALNAAAEGQTVSVLNLLSKKVITGTATSAGTVTVHPGARTNG